MSFSTSSALLTLLPSTPQAKTISRMESSSPHMGDGALPSELVSSACKSGLALLSRSTPARSCASNWVSSSVLLPISQATTT